MSNPLIFCASIKHKVLLHFYAVVQVCDARDDDWKYKRPAQKNKTATQKVFIYSVAGPGFTRPNLASKLNVA